MEYNIVQSYLQKLRKISEILAKFSVADSSNKILLETKVSTNENGEIISQIVGFSEGCDQKGDRVSKNNEICHNCIRWLKSFLLSYEKTWDSVYT